MLNMYHFTNIKKEPHNEEHNDKILQRWQIKPDPESDYNYNQLKQEPDDEESVGAQLEDLYLIYEGHQVKEEMVLGQVELQQPGTGSQIYKENIKAETPHEARKSFPTSSTLTHRQTHKFKCDICKEQFRNKHRLKAHVETHNGSTFKKEPNEDSNTEMKSFPCDVCDKKFKQMGHLTRHLRQHSDGKRYTCHVCKKTFTQRESLGRHITEVHNDLKRDKPFPCHICNIKFARKGDVKNHLRVHSGEKPFSCEICGLSFKRKLTLTDHLREVHAGEKRFRCDVCLERFSRKLTLVRHKRGHSGDKPFTCGVCDKRFTRKWSLTTHTCNSRKPRAKQPKVVYSTTFKMKSRS